MNRLTCQRSACERLCVHRGTWHRCRFDWYGLHACADGITRGQDIVGSDNILAWLQSYPNQYDYKSHEVIAGAVDEQNNSAFSFFLDQVTKIP